MKGMSFHCFFCHNIFERFQSWFVPFTQLGYIVVFARSKFKKEPLLTLLSDYKVFYVSQQYFIALYKKLFYI